MSKWIQEPQVLSEWKGYIQGLTSIINNLQSIIEKLAHVNTQNRDYIIRLDNEIEEVKKAQEELVIEYERLKAQLFTKE